MIRFNVPPYVGKETEYMKEAIDSHKICGDGEFTKRCNAWIEEHTGTAKALLTTSGTQALEMAALLSDIQPGDEVILPSYTFVSTANAFALRGAKLVFVDIRPDTMNIDETLIEDAITEKTTFVDDLGVDSLDFFQILIDLEETFDVRIDPEEAEEIVTVGDAVETLRRVTKGRRNGK